MASARIDQCFTDDYEDSAHPSLEVSKQLLQLCCRIICRIHRIRKKVRHFREKRGLPDKCVTLYEKLKFYLHCSPSSQSLQASCRYLCIHQTIFLEGRCTLLHHPRHRSRTCCTQWGQGERRTRSFWGTNHLGPWEALQILLIHNMYPYIHCYGRYLGKIIFNF